MKIVAIVYHSGYGHTEKQANAVFEGVKSVNDVEAHLIKVSEVEEKIDILNKANAIIFGSPTYMGSISAEFKKFMEYTSKHWSKQLWLNKLAAGFVNSGSMNGDKFNSMSSLVTFASQHGMIWVSLGLLPSSSSKSARDDLNYLGGYVGALAQSSVDLDKEAAPPKGDLETAKCLGERVAKIALKFDN